jgi:hypothetical protein
VDIGSAALTKIQELHPHVNKNFRVTFVKRNWVGGVDVERCVEAGVTEVPVISSGISSVMAFT